MAEAKQGISTDTLIKVGGGIVVILMLRSVLQSAGIISDPAVDNAGVNKDYWSMSYYESLNWPQSKDDEVYTRALPAAKIIKEYPGAISDDFAAVMAGIKMMRTQAEISFLVAVFYYEYGQDLYEFLRKGDKGQVLPWDGLSNAHLKQVNDYIDKLPKQ